MEAVMNKPYTVLITFIAAMVIFCISPELLSANSLFEKSLGMPIIEGKEAAGIKLGESETRVIGLMGGVPLHIEGYGEPEKTFNYGTMSDEGGVGINIFIKNGVVIGIEIISRPLLSKGHLYKGKTKKNVSFGDSIDKINVLYGKAYRIFVNKIFWYKKEGIIFEYLGWDNETADKIIPNAIVIIAPGSDIVPHLRKRGGYE
jgi:hypothetical protein